MCKKLFFLPLIAAMVLTGCSSDEPTTTPVNGGEESYLAVRLLAPSSSLSRAEANDFVDGTAVENTVTSATFFFFDAAGNAVQTPQTVDLTWQNDLTNAIDPAVEKISNAVAVIAGNTEPAQLLVLLNAPTALVTSLSNVPLVTVYANVVKSETYNILGTDGKAFIMSNSSYMNDDNIIRATQLESDDFYKTKEAAEEAENGCVDVYVERLAAKITTQEGNNGFVENNSTIMVGTTEVTLYPDVQGIEIANIATSEYLYKNIDGIASQWEGANDAANYRYNWANIPSSVTYSNQSWNQIKAEDKARESKLFLTSGDNPFYVMENTSSTQHTSVLITAQLRYTADFTANGKDYKKDEGANIVRWAGNYYFGSDFLRQYAQILNNAGYRLRSDDVTRQVAASDLRYLTDEEHETLANRTSRDTTADEAFLGYETTACLTDDAKQKTVMMVSAENPNAFEESSVDELNNFLLKKVNRVWAWDEGRCYYYVDIAHYGPTAPFNTGVVRNHVYQLTLNSLSGLGVPVTNPDETIIPEKPSDDLFYISAMINILKWRIVSQTVDFE